MFWKAVDKISFKLSLPECWNLDFAAVDISEANYILVGSHSLNFFHASDMKVSDLIENEWIA